MTQHENLTSTPESTSEVQTHILEGKPYLQGKFIQGEQLERYLLSGGKVLHVNKLAKYKLDENDSLRIVHQMENSSVKPFRSLEDLKEDGAYKMLPQ